MLKIVKKPVAEKAAATTDKAESTAATQGNATSKTTVMALEAQALPPMCVVSLEVGYSHKLPSEDWIKVGLKLDIPAKYEDIDKVFAYAKEWTDAKLNDAVAEITAEG